MAKKKTASNQDAKSKAGAAANSLVRADVAQPPNAPKAAAAGAPAPRAPFRRPPTLNFAGVGRNDLCPCGSGKRFKNCHGH